MNGSYCRRRSIIQCRVFAVAYSHTTNVIPQTGCTPGVFQFTTILSENIIDAASPFTMLSAVAVLASMVTLGEARINLPEYTIDLDLGIDFCIV